MKKILKDFEVKGIDVGGEYQFEGYGSTYENRDRDGDIFKKGSFGDSLRTKKNFPLMFNHNKDIVLGKVEVVEDEVGLRTRGYLNLKNEKANEIYDLIKMGALSGLSVGFRVKDYEPVDNARPFSGMLIKKADIYEISVVTIPANPEAEIAEIKSFDDYKDEIKKAIKELFYKQNKSHQISKSRHFYLLRKIEKITGDIKNIEENLNYCMEEI